MSETLRVTMVIQRFRPAFSGQGIQLEAVTQALVRRGVDVTIVTATEAATSARLPGGSVEDCGGYSVVRLGYRPPSGLSPPVRSRLTGPAFAAQTFAFLQTRGRCDLVHVHAMTDALYAGFVWCHLHGKPLLFEMTLVGTDDPWTVARSRNRFAALRRHAYYGCDGYVAISPALQAIGRQAGLSGRVKLVPQGIDVDRFTPVTDRSSLRRELGLPTDGPLVVCVGSLVHRKGFDLVLDAWLDICQAHRNAHLVLVGRDEFDSHSTEAAFLSDQLGRVSAAAAQRIHRVGIRDDVHRFLQASDLFLFASRREGFGTVMIEAMACALPCVVAELPGITDFVFQKASTGVVVAQEDPRALGEATNRLLADPGAARSVGQAAREDVVSRFDINMIADRYIEYYEALIAGVNRRGLD